MICEYLPSQIATICGFSTSAILWLLGDVDLSITWLFVFCVIDYTTGTLSAFKCREWSSAVGSHGIIKKVIMFLFVILAHGIDEVAHIEYIRQAVIIAYIINESGSILENIERMGYGKAIPPILRNSLKLLSMKNENIIKDINPHSDISHTSENK